MSKREVRLMQGNEACAEAALYAGVKFFAGYPITPATEIMEILSRKLPQVGGVFLQMEDEISSMAAVIGASIGGLKSLTATSGPGFTLKQENIGYAAMVEIPCVIVDVQRGGPSTWLPTLPAQMDVMQARWGTHGDHPIVVLCPSTVYEYYTLTVQAVNFAEMLRTPVIVLSDAIVGHLREKVVLPELGELKIVNRKMTTVAPKDFLPYKADEDGVPPFVNYGTGYRYHITSNNHDEGGFPATNNHQIADSLLRRLHDKVEKRRSEIVITEEIMTEDADVIIFAYGCTARSAYSAVEEARKKGMKVGRIKALTLWPFPFEVLLKYSKQAKHVIVPEMNLGQLAGEVERTLKDCPVKVTRLNRIDGRMITPEQIVSTISEVI